MTDDMNDLDDLSQLWTSENSPVTGDFEKRIKVRHLKMIALVAIEAIVTVIGIAAGLYEIAKGSFVLGLSILIFSAAALGLVFWSRSGAWDVSTGSVKDELLASIKQTHAQYRWALSGIWLSAFGLIFLAILTYLRGVSADQPYPESHDLFLRIIFALVFIASNLVFVSFLLEKSRKRLFKLKLLHTQLIESNH